MFKKFKLKKYLLTTVFTVISLFANNLLFSFNQREKHVLAQLQNNYTNKINNLEHTLSPNNKTQIKIVSKELQKQLLEITKEISKETNSEKLEILEKAKTSLETKINKISKIMYHVLAEEKTLNAIKQQLLLIKTGVITLNTQENSDDKKILSEKSITDLEIFSTIGSDRSLFESIDYTISSLGKIQLALELDIKRQNKEELEKMTSQINELLSNEELFNNLGTNIHNTVEHVENYLTSIHELKNTAKETQISEFMQNSENKLSYYIKTSLIDGYIAATDNMKNKLIMSFIPMIPSIFKGGFLGNIEVFNELLRKTFSLQTYKSWKFVATFAAQLAIGRLPSLLRLGGSIGLSIAATKLLGIPYTTFNMAMIPFRGIMEMEKSIQIQYKEKQNFKNNILQRFYSLNVLLSQLKKLSQIVESNENLKSLTISIKKLVDYNQEDMLGNFLTLIKNVTNYESYKNKNFIQALYKTYISIFIKMENPEYKKLIINVLKEFGQIDLLLSKVQICKTQGYAVPKYIEKEGKPYIYFKNTNNPIIIENLEQNTNSNKIEHIENKIMELNENNIQGFNENLDQNFKTFVYNLILSHIGIVKAKQAIITPVDNILTMLNTSNTKNLAKIVTKIYKQEKSETSMIFINNTELKQMTKEEDYSEYTTYNNLFDSLTQELLPAMPNSYCFFTI